MAPIERPAIASVDSSCSNLRSLINSFSWNDAIQRVSSHPEEARHYDRNRNETALHLVCSVGGAPSFLVQQVLLAWPAATSMANCKYGETPLHLQCRNSQRSANEVSVLIQHGRPEALYALNHQGQSPLHVACVSNAMLPVLKKLVQAQPCMLLSRDASGAIPAALQWDSYAKSLQGMAAIESVLNHDNYHHNTKHAESIPQHLQRFWDKMEFLLLATHAANTKEPPESRNVLQAIVPSLRRPRNLRLFCLALKLHPELTRHKDSQGQLPLHVVAANAATSASVEALKVLIKADRHAAGIDDEEGQVPLTIALTSGKRWDEGVADLVFAAPEVLRKTDPKSGLFPFQLAVNGCKSSFSCVNTAFCLLSSCPEVIMTEPSQQACQSGKSNSEACKD